MIFINSAADYIYSVPQNSGPSHYIADISGEPNSLVRFGINLVAELFGSVRFGSVRPIFSDFYLIVRFGLPNSSAKFWPNSSVRFGRVQNWESSVRFGAKIPSSVHHYFLCFFSGA